MVKYYRRISRIYAKWLFGWLVAGLVDGLTRRILGWPRRQLATRGPRGGRLVLAPEMSLAYLWVLYSKGFRSTGFFHVLDECTPLWPSGGSSKRPRGGSEAKR